MIWKKHQQLFCRMGETGLSEGVGILFEKKIGGFN